MLALSADCWGSLCKPRPCSAPSLLLFSIQQVCAHSSSAVRVPHRDSNSSSPSKGLEQKRGEGLSCPVSYSPKTHNGFSHWNLSLVCVSVNILTWSVQSISKCDFENGSFMYKAIFTTSQCSRYDRKPPCHNLFLIQTVLIIYRNNDMCSCT